MDKAEMIWIASVAIGKNLDYETLMYSDYLYGKEKYIDEIWEYVTTAKEQGTNWFYEKYSNHKLY